MLIRLKFYFWISIDCGFMFLYVHWQCLQCTLEWFALPLVSSSEITSVSDNNNINKHIKL